MAAPSPYRPFGLRAVNALGGLASRAGLKPALDRESLMAAAEKRTGMHDWDGTEFTAGLDALLHSLEHESQLNTIGRITARTYVGARLETRLRMVDWRRRHPEIDEEPIDRPIFVLGLPRTGTTVLYGVLAANPAWRSPVSWEVDRPVPPPAPGTADTDPRRREFDEKTVAGLEKIAPAMQMIHPVGSMLPQECIAMHSLEARSYEYIVTFPVNGYMDFLREHGIADAYRRQRWYLQHLQSGYGGERWILKSPAHLMWLDQLLDEFPDALFVQTHRDPAKVLGSVSSLYWTMHSAVSDHVDPAAIGRRQLDDWQWGLEQAMAARERIPDDRVVDVHFEETLRDPVGVARRIHDHFGLEFTDEAAVGVEDYLADNARDKHGVHTYELEDFGLDRDEVDAAFAHYRDRFGVSREA